MILDELYKLKIIANSIGVDYHRLRRAVKGNSGSRISVPERKALKEFVQIEAERCLKEIDEML